MKDSSLAVHHIGFYPQSVRAIKVREDPGRSNREKIDHSAASESYSAEAAAHPGNELNIRWKITRYVRGRIPSNLSLITIFY